MSEKVPDFPHKREHVSAGKLTMQDIEVSLHEAKLSEEDFDSAWQLGAVIYRALLWELANDFSGRSGISTEMTHSEYGKDPDTKKIILDLCLEFIGPEEEPQQVNKYPEFKEYLEHRLELIPSELRKKFDVAIGFNYGDFGGLRVRDNNIEGVSQEFLNTFPSEGRIGYPRNMNKEYDFREKLHVKVKHLLGQ